MSIFFVLLQAELNIFCDITIETNGGVTILANGFSRSDANTIVNMLNR